MAVLLAIVVFMLLHIGLLALWAHLFRIRICHITLGFGPGIWRSDKLIIKAIPCGGSVTLLDSREMDVAVSDQAYAFNHKPFGVQSALPLLACLSMFLLLFVWQGVLIPQALVSGAEAFVLGALSPFADAPVRITAMLVFLTSQSDSTIIAITMAKLLALNLLPLGALNGAQILFPVLRRAGLPERWLMGYVSVSMLVLLAMLLSWLVALLCFFF